MTEIAIFAENSLFAPSEPFSSKRRRAKSEEKRKNLEVILGGFEVMGWHKNLSESLRINRKQSESIRANRS